MIHYICHPSRRNRIPVMTSSYTGICISRHIPSSAPTPKGSPPVSGDRLRFCPRGVMDALMEDDGGKTFTR